MNTEKPSILIVDDEPDELMLLGNILREEQYDVNYATDGKDGVALAKAKSFDLILLDVMMPQIDGYDVCKLLKEDALTKDVPVIFLTALSEPHNIAKGFGLGAQDYLLKPIKSNELMIRVKTHLDLKRKTEQVKELKEILDSKTGNNHSHEEGEVLSGIIKKRTKLDKTIKNFVYLFYNIINNSKGINSIIEELQETLPQQNSVCKDLIKQSSLLTEIVDSAILVDALNAEDLKQQIDYVSINDIILQISKELKNILDAREISINYKNLPQELEIKTNRNIMKQCLTNILYNAVARSSKGSSIAIQTSAISGKELVSIEITDTGEAFSDTIIKVHSNLKNLHHSVPLAEHEIKLLAARIMQNALYGSLELKSEPTGNSIILHLRNLL